MYPAPEPGPPSAPCHQVLIHDSPCATWKTVAMTSFASQPTKATVEQSVVLEGARPCPDQPGSHSTRPRGHPETMGRKGTCDRWNPYKKLEEHQDVFREPWANQGKKRKNHEKKSRETKEKRWGNHWETQWETQCAVNLPLKGRWSSGLKNQAVIGWLEQC